MKAATQNRFLPYEADYSLLSLCRAWETRGLWIIGILSVVSPILDHFSESSLLSQFYSVLSFIYIVVIIAYYVLNTITETFLYPATAQKRRKGFIDNSLGSKYLEKQVEDYYTNDSLYIGPYKMLVNCAENCFFTLNIAKGMILQVIIKNAAFFILLLVTAYFGLIDNLVTIPVLQIFLSTLFLSGLIHHFTFIAKLKYLFERFMEAFSKKADEKQILQDAVLLVLEYETTLAYNKAPLSDVVYKRLNEKLSREWDEIKKRYEIS